MHFLFNSEEARGAGLKSFEETIQSFRAEKPAPAKAQEKVAPHEEPIKTGAVTLLR